MKNLIKEELDTVAKNYKKFEEDVIIDSYIDDYLINEKETKTTRFMQKICFTLPIIFFIFTLIIMIMIAKISTLKNLMVKMTQAIDSISSYEIMINQKPITKIISVNFKESCPKNFQKLTLFKLPKINKGCVCSNEKIYPVRTCKLDNKCKMVNPYSLKKDTIWKNKKFCVLRSDFIHHNKQNEKCSKIIIIATIYAIKINALLLDLPILQIGKKNF